MDTTEMVDVTLTGGLHDLAARGRRWLFVILVIAPGTGSLSAAVLFAH